MIHRPTNAPPLLVVDDDPYLLAAIKQTLTLNGFLVDTFHESKKALSAIRENAYSTLVVDIKMPQMDGIQLFHQVKALDPELPVILITGHGDVKMAVSAMREGVYDFLQKPVDEDILIASIERAVEKRRLTLENRALHDRLQRQRQTNHYHGLTGGHPIMRQLYELIEAVALEDDPVLLSGETGTGKELVARAIHEAGNRRERPFVPVNMGAIPVEMIESELFGHTRGAFTGAVLEKQGKFQYADDGTIFLDEICSMPASLQPKILRVLEEKKVTPLGSNQPIPIRARIISATNRDLEQEVREGTFRQDLYFRLNVLPVRTPALRERVEDIPLLVEQFRQEYCQDRQVQIPPFSAGLMVQLQRKNWPGNIRELKNYVRRLCVFGIQSAAQNHPTDDPVGVTSDMAPSICMKPFLEQMEKEYLIRVLRKNRGKIALTYEALGISRKCLYDKVKKYNLDLETFRNEADG